MELLEFIEKNFFPGQKIDQDTYYKFKERNCDTIRAGWIVQRSEDLAVAMVNSCIETRPDITIESLQILLNDLVSDGGLSLLKEDGNIGPKTIQVLDKALASVDDAENFLASKL